MPGDTFEITANDLDSEADYNFQIAAVTDAGVGSFTETKVGKTHSNVWVN